MSCAILKSDKKYTYGDYLNWPGDQRWELIAGVAYNMSPAPARKHQGISGALFTQLYNYLKGKNCKVYHAPFDVRLPVGNEKDEDVQTVVQPDITVICDHSKLDDKGCRGNPDLVIEIISPATLRKDIKEKFNLYEQVGVKEYWIVYPLEKTVTVFKLDSSGKYGRPEVYAEEEQVKVEIFDDLIIDLAVVFED
ncbi:MAG: Uma2 family endonuclease [Desulfotomaculum sp.]|nr:Uma2 family endonuclease [Desulfotomaculum sp.]